MYLISYSIFVFLKVMNLTYRFEFQNTEAISDASKENPPTAYILALWHQNIMASILAHTDKKFSMLISQSKDGEYVAKVCQLFGHEPIRGSSSRGAISALIHSIRSLKSGKPSAVAIDGPRGPIYSIKPGVFEMARRAGVPIIPMTISAKSYWSFNKAWDKFRIPKPFTKIIIHYGEPILINEQVDKTQMQSYAQKLFNSLMSEEEKIAASFA
jgi:hypothetical protein